MGVYLEKPEDLSPIASALLKIAGIDEFEAFRFCDDFEGEPKVYNAYKIVTRDAVLVLKKAEDNESFEAEKKHYALLRGLPAPRFIGAAEGFILTRFVEGDDLKTASDEGVLAAAESLAAIMNAYPMGREYEKERYEIYLKRLERRAGCLKYEPELARAFALFIKRQKSIPLTLSNSDLLPINMLYDGEKATLIDWEFGGFMPYSLDIIRFTAHGCEHGETPFYMTDAQKRLFINAVYEKLAVKPGRERYDADLELAEFNECIEILEYYFNEPEAERGETFAFYYPRAKALAKDILSE